MKLLLTVLVSVTPLAVQARDTREAGQRIIAKIADCELSELWGHAAELTSLGEAGVSVVRDGLASTSVKVQLACAKALLFLGEPEEAEKTLRQIADSREPPIIRTAALALLRSSLDEALVPIIQRIAQNDPEPVVRIEAARTLWEISEDAASQARKLLERFLDSGDKRLRDRAALALGEIGYVVGLTKRILVRLSNEPTAQGRQAALILQIERLARQEAEGPNPFHLDAKALLKEKEARIEQLEESLKVLQEQGLQESGDPLLSWLRDTVRKFYVDAKDLKDIDLELTVGAAKGAIQTLDRFSSFMDVKETKDFSEGIRGSYTGIGAQISQDRDTGALAIVRPLAGGPARKEGLKPRDRILEIDGRPTKGKPMSLIVRWLKGTPGTTVTLKIARRGWREPQEKVITREEIKVESMHSTLLPGGIGYFRPDQFGETTYLDLRKALDSLKKNADGTASMQGIILDLRGNPGGLLAAAVAIVDLFIADDVRPIVTQRGPVGEKEEISHDIEPQYLTEPLVILVDGTSASASEIVAGALQDFDQRAVLVGEKTYGKGSVQRIFSVPPEIAALLGGRAALRLTVQYYYLPSGRCIHTRRDADGAILEPGGVKPDIEVSQETIPLWKAHEFEKLIEDAALQDYVRQLLNEDSEVKSRETCVNLLKSGDGGDPFRYPGFKAFYEKTKDTVKLEPADVRVILRSELRRSYEDGTGRQLACDFQDDRQLQRGILEVLKRLSLDPHTIPEYVSFAPKKEQATAKAKPVAEPARAGNQ